MKIDPRLVRIVEAQPYPLVFATISGAHLYGFPSPDSDFDLRGAHNLPLPDVLGLRVKDETIDDSRIVEGMEMDIVSHDIRKFMGLLLKKNGYVLEQLFSPLVVLTSDEHQELKQIAAGCITRHHSHHYLGFSATQWKLFHKESPRRVKPLLYVFRVLLTGIWLMRTGRIEAHLPTLNESFQLPYLPRLIASKVEGIEKQTMEGGDVDFYEKEYLRLTVELEQAHLDSALPERPVEKTQMALNDLLIRLRLAESQEGAADITEG